MNSARDQVCRSRGLILDDRLCFFLSLLVELIAVKAYRAEMIKIRTQRDQRDIIEMTVLSELYVCFLIDLVTKRASLRLSFRSVNLFKRRKRNNN